MDLSVQAGRLLEETPVEYIGPGGTGRTIGDRYNRFGIWLQRGEPVWIPWVGLALDDQISFTDGRHRFAWLRDHGVTALPIDVDGDELARIEKRFGTSERASIFMNRKSKRKA
jgi:hypothetical protein